MIPHEYFYQENIDSSNKYKYSYDPFMNDMVGHLFIFDLGNHPNVCFDECYLRKFEYAGIKKM